MLCKTAGIILKQTKYNDTSRIVTIFLKKHGKKSFIVYGNRNNKKKKYFVNLFQPLIQLNIEFNYQENRNLQKIKEASLLNNYTSIPFQIEKSSIILFLSEILNKIFKNDYFDEQVFDFIINSLNIFDLQDNNFMNFHLSFLIQLIKKLGFEINNNYSIKNKFFNIKNSFFSEFYEDVNSINENNSKIISDILKIKIQNNNKIRMNNKTRQEILNIILKYYSYHIENLQNINSLIVLNQIFSSEELRIKN